MLRCLILAALLAGATADRALAEVFVEPGDQTATPWGFVKVSSPVRAGAVAQMFEARAGDCGGTDCGSDSERAEVAAIRDQWGPGDVRWIGYSIMVPTDFVPSDPVVTMAGQVHVTGGPLAADGGSPGVLLMVIGEVGYHVCVHRHEGPREAYSAPCEHIMILPLDAMRGRWTDIQIGVDLATPGTVVEFWANGHRVGQVSDFHRHYAENYVLKYGIYRSDVSRYGGPLPTQRLFYDEVRIGMTREEVVIDEARHVD